MEKMRERWRVCSRSCVRRYDVANWKLESFRFWSGLFSCFCLSRCRGMGSSSRWVPKQCAWCWLMAVLLWRRSKELEHEPHNAVPLHPCRALVPFYLRRRLWRWFRLLTIRPCLYVLHLGCNSRRINISNRISLPLHKRRSNERL